MTPHTEEEAQSIISKSVTDHLGLDALRQGTEDISFGSQVSDLCF